MKEQEGIDLHFDLFSFINSYTERFLFLHLGIYWTASQASCLSFTSPVQENQGMSWWRFPHGWLAAEPTKLHYIMFSVFCPVTNEFWVLKFVFWHYLQRSFFFFFFFPMHFVHLLLLYSWMLLLALCLQTGLYVNTFYPTTSILQCRGIEMQDLCSRHQEYPSLQDSVVKLFESPVVCA